MKFFKNIFITGLLLFSSLSLANDREDFDPLPFDVVELEKILGTWHSDQGSMKLSDLNFNYSGKPVLFAQFEDLNGEKTYGFVYYKSSLDTYVVYRPAQSTSYIDFYQSKNVGWTILNNGQSSCRSHVMLIEMADAVYEKRACDQR